MLGLSFDPLQAAEHAKGVKLNPKMKDGWHYGHCRMCMRGTCPNMYRVENGIAVEIMGNPATPTTRGAALRQGSEHPTKHVQRVSRKGSDEAHQPEKGLGRGSAMG